MNAAAPEPAKPDFEVAIIGTGFAGLCMAIKLRQQGERSFVLIERAASVGGTWRDNSYPGAACDVPSHLYSLSFEPKTDWSRKYPNQAELKAYLEGVADKYGLRPHIRFGADLRSAAYDEAAGCWRIETAAGGFSARVLVSGAGGLAEPKLPDIPGIAGFRGKIFHSSQWDHGYELRGKRVAVIGTGASAIQFVPEIAPLAQKLEVYQRSPNWIIPRPDRPYTTVEKWLFAKLPFTRRLHRGFIYWAHELRVLGMVLHPALMKLFQFVAQLHLRRQVPDLAMRARLTPDYTIGCKRVLISNDWYPALQRPNVDLVTTGIREVVGNGIVTADGQLHEADCIVLGTGFYATENPIAQRIHGCGGRSLAQAWQQGEEAYLGTVVKGFPNLYLIVGPNTALGHSSMVFMIETQVAYIQRMLAHAQQSGARTLEVRGEVQDAFNRELQTRLAGSIWATGCNSWYKHRSGKITALWPDFTFNFWRRTRDFRGADYKLSPETPAVRV